ncbi:MAG: dienelactone hydrolase [Vicinamibacteria bacterium]|nr:dienelactone hydrolase [Vicinamibacteria bacterium]
MGRPRGYPRPMKAVARMTGCALALCLAAAASPQNRIDVVTPVAPELASYGPLAVGVRTIQVTDRNRPDILNTKPGEPPARYDRTLTVEVWYPATLAPGQPQRGNYPGVITRDPSVVVTLHGRAVRDATPLAKEGGYPLVIVSHGYPGNRYLLSHLAENLASKGYVVASIDHKDSTYDDQKAFASTLYNRPFDVLSILNELQRLGRKESAAIWGGLIDASRTGVVGYSMGGYGVVNLLGGGLTKAFVSASTAPPNGLLGERSAANPEYLKTMDPRIKAAIAIAPWGMQVGAWDAEGLKAIKTPVMFVAGSADDVSEYEKGTRAIFLAATNADRYLLTYVNANHNAGAPIPAPEETYFSKDGRPPGFTHYNDAVWDTVRMNNILDHFATAFFDTRLKGDAEKQAYLDLIPNGRDGVFALDKDGRPTTAHTYWRGFSRRTAVGLVLEHLAPGR